MANKNQEPISPWGCVKAIYFSGILVVFLIALIDGCDDSKKSGSPYATALAWIYLLAVLYGLLNSKFKKDDWWG